MNAQKKQEEDKISMFTISKMLERVLDEVKVITDEIQEMKDRDGGPHGDN